MKRCRSRPARPPPLTPLSRVVRLGPAHPTRQAAQPPPPPCMCICPTTYTIPGFPAALSPIPITNRPSPTALYAPSPPLPLPTPAGGL